MVLSFLANVSTIENTADQYVLAVEGLEILLVYFSVLFFPVLIWFQTRHQKEVRGMVDEQIKHQIYLSQEKWHAIDLRLNTIEITLQRLLDNKALELNENAPSDDDTSEEHY